MGEYLMKRFMSVLFLLVSVVFCLSAWTETGTMRIFLVAQKALVYPEFMLVCAQTGEAGTSLTYRTTEIARRDVSADLSIVQVTDSNYRGRVHLGVEAGSLGDGRHFTQPPVFRYNGSESGSLQLDIEYAQPVGAHEVMPFSVVWSTRPGLPEGYYRALITLTVHVY